jgi:hypothetical protein
METQLESLFNSEYKKVELKKLSFEQQKIDKWNKDLKKINEIYDNLSFLNNKGIKIEKVFCTEFNPEKANRGFYPYLRMPQFMAIFYPIHDNENFDFKGNANYSLNGNFNYETFVNKLLQIL